VPQASLPGGSNASNTASEGNLQGAIAAGDLKAACPNQVSGNAVRCNVYIMTPAGLSVFHVPPIRLRKLQQKTAGD